MKILALDIGGTNLKYGLIDEDDGGNRYGEIPSNARFGAKKLLETLYSVCDAEEFDLIGVSTAGMVAKDGSIAYANENIPDYTGVRLKDLLESRYGVKAYVLNDIAAGAIAETTDSNRDFYYLALGTGVGGISVENGLPSVGVSGVAGQIGYLPSIDASGIVDKTASTSALNRLGGIDAKELFERVERGDECASSVISKWAREVMHVVSLVVGFCDPGKVIIGGGVSRQKSVLIKYLDAERDVLPIPYRDKIVIETASNEGNVGVIGAAKYAKERYENERKRQN